MTNLQMAEKVISDMPGDILDIIDIFHTIQGEGPYAGMPAIFLRLAGCNLQCPGCDTDYTSKRRQVSVTSLVDELKDKFTRYPNTSLLVITGGEPLRQNLFVLLKTIDKYFRDNVQDNIKIQIETNGTVFDPYVMDYITSVVCSPKTPNINSQLRHYVSAYKYILQAGEVSITDGLPTCSLGMTGQPYRPNSYFDRTKIFVQPMDEGDPVKNKANLDACVDSCMTFGYRLSVQLHKLAGLE